ncbi:MAG: Gfo/Idh/MocA family oxidoreductase [Ginsengibacter sp.]
MQRKEKLRWGLIGAGHISHAFMKDFQFMKNAELVAVAASDKTRGEEYAKKYNIPISCSYQELYASKEVDAVYISTTHNFHYEQALACLQNGKAVLCEKPITVNIEECNELIKVAKEQKVFLMEAMWTCFLPAIRQAKQWIREGRIGNLKVIQADFGFSMEKNRKGRIYNPDLAGGSLLDLGVYPISMANYFADEFPELISASAVFTETGVDERLAMILQYGEITATLFSSIICRMANACCLFGEKGYIELPEFWRASSAKIFNGDFELIETFDDKRSSHGFIYEMQHANDRVLTGHIESDIVPLSNTRDVQAIMMEVRRQIGLTYPMDRK